MQLILLLIVVVHSVAATLSILKSTGETAITVPTFSYFGNVHYGPKTVGLPVQLYLNASCLPLLEDKGVNRLPGMQTWKESVLWFEWDDALACGLSHYAQLFPLVQAYNASLVDSGAPGVHTLVIFASYLYRFQSKLNPLLEPYRPKTLGQEYRIGFRPPRQLNVLFVSPMDADQLQVVVDSLNGQRWAWQYESHRDVWNEMALASLFNYFRFLCILLEVIALTASGLQLYNMMRIKRAMRSFFLAYLCANIIGIVLVMVASFLPMVSLSTWILKEIVMRWFCVMWTASLFILSTMKNTIKKDRETMAVACSILCALVVTVFTVSMIIGPQSFYGSILFILGEHAVPFSFFVFALLPLGYLRYAKTGASMNVRLYHRVHQVILVWLGVLFVDELLHLRIISNHWNGSGPLPEALWIITSALLTCASVLLSTSVMLLLYSRKSTEQHQDGVVDWFGRQQSHHMTSGNTTDSKA